MPVQIGGVAVGDLNKDGRADVLVGAYMPPYGVSVFFGSGAGSFLSPVLYALPGGTRQIVTADYNGDGNLDFITGTGSPQLRLGDGTGGFRSGQSLVSAPATQAYSLAQGDLNGDGQPDIVTFEYNYNPPHLSVFLHP